MTMKQWHYFNLTFCVVCCSHTLPLTEQLESSANIDYSCFSSLFKCGYPLNISQLKMVVCRYVKSRKYYTYSEYDTDLYMSFF